MSNRVIVYPGQTPKSTDFLQSQLNFMEAIGGVLSPMVGTGTYVTGLVCNPTSPASLSVTVTPGIIIAPTVVDTSAFGGIAANSSPLLKIGQNLTPTSFTLTAPIVSGQSINYLIEATFEEIDGTPLELSYYNASSPTTPYTGPNGNGVAQNTTRNQIVGLQLKAGAAANTGSQITPSVDVGWSALYVITVNFGQTQITAANITTAPNAPFLPNNLAGLRIPVTGGTLNVYVSPTGSDNNTGTSVQFPFQTLQGALNVVATKYDLTGTQVQLNLAQGTYAGVSISGTSYPFIVSIVGEGSAIGVVISGVDTSAIVSSFGGNVTISNLAIQASGSGSDYSSGGIGLYAANGGVIQLGPNIIFGTCSQTHMQASIGGYIAPASGAGLTYTIGSGATAHMQVGNAGTISMADSTVNINGTPHFSTAFAVAVVGGDINAWNITYNGSATGVRYIANNFGVISVQGAGANYFPGSSAGTVSQGIYG